MNIKEMLQNKKLLAAVAALLVVVLLICLVAGGNKAEKTVKNYISYMQKEKVEKLYKTLPKAIRNYMKEEDYEEDYEEDDYEADEDSNKDKGYVHYCAVGGNTVLACKAQKLIVI